jgi:hypothetical protein
MCRSKSRTLCVDRTVDSCRLSAPPAGGRPLFRSAHRLQKGRERPGTNFWAVQSPKGRVAPARFESFFAGHFFFRWFSFPFLSGTCVCHKVKDPEKFRVEGVICTDFTRWRGRLHSRHATSSEMRAVMEIPGTERKSRRLECKAPNFYASGE